MALVAFCFKSMIRSSLCFSRTKLTISSNFGDSKSLSSHPLSIFLLKNQSFHKMMVYRNHFWKYFGKKIISQNDSVQKSFLEIFWKKNHFPRWSLFSVLMQFGIPKLLSHGWFRSRMTVIGKKLSVAWMDWYIIVFSSRCFNTRSTSCRSTKWNVLDEMY